MWWINEIHEGTVVFELQIETISVWVILWIMRVRGCLHEKTRTGASFTLGWRFWFWYRCEISYRSEILAPVREPGWTHAGVTRAGITFCGGIM